MESPEDRLLFCSLIVWPWILIFLEFKAATRDAPIIPPIIPPTACNLAQPATPPTATGLDQP